MTSRHATWLERWLRPSRVVPPALAALIVVLGCADGAREEPCEGNSGGSGRCQQGLVCCPAPGTALPNEPANTDLPRQLGVCQQPPCEGATPSTSTTSSSTTTTTSTTTTSTTTVGGTTTTTRPGVRILPFTFKGPFNLTPVPNHVFTDGTDRTDRVIVAGDGGANLYHARDPYFSAWFYENLFTDPPPPFGTRFFALPLVNGLVEAITGGPAIGVRHWDRTPPAGFGFQLVVPFESAANGRLYGNDPAAGGAVMGGSAKLNVVEFDSQTGFFSTGALRFFPSGSTVVSGYRASATSVALAITDGTPGHLWKHAGPGNAPVDLGAVGNAPRDVNVEGSVGVVANNGSDSLTVFTLNGNTATIRSTVGVGDGPVFANLRTLPGGNVRALSTGFNDGSLWSTTVEPDGDVVENVRLTAFICNQPAEAEFSFEAIEAGVAYVPCHADDLVLRVDLSAFPQ